MEKEDYTNCITMMGSIRDLIITLTGNMSKMGKVIEGTDLERAYNRQGIYIDPGEVVDALHNLAVMQMYMQNGRELMEHQGH